jgi:ubiquitin C-terminal hydrolase
MGKNKNKKNQSTPRPDTSSWGDIYDNKTNSSKNEEIDEQRKKITVRGLSGLKNIGNTCYMNSALQCLVADGRLTGYFLKKQFLPDLRSNIEEKLSNEKRKKSKIPDDVDVELYVREINDGTKETVTYGFYNLVKNMWSENVVVVPRQFKSIIGSLNDMFRGYSQNDSQELLSAVLDYIHEELKSEVKLEFRNIPDHVIEFGKLHHEYSKKIKKNLSVTDKEQLKSDYLHLKMSNYKSYVIYQSLRFSKSLLEKSHSMINDLFSGIYYSEIECQSCKTKSPKFEEFKILSLELPQNKFDTTLEKCLDQFTTPQKLSGSDKYLCEVCNSKQEAIKKMNLWDSPEILVIQLKRFVNDGSRSMKLDTRVNFPIESFKLTGSYSEYNPKNYEYELYGLVKHSGSLGGGHYVALCKNAMNGKWYEFDDDDVVHIPNDKLENEIITRGSYILFYRKKNVNLIEDDDDL